MFAVEAVDLGELFEIDIRHDNTNFSPAWYLDKVEVKDVEENKNYVFHCERWLAKNKDDGQLARTLMVQGYHQGEIGSLLSLRSFFL